MNIYSDLLAFANKMCAMSNCFLGIFSIGCLLFSNTFPFSIGFPLHARDWQGKSVYDILFKSFEANEANRTMGIEHLQRRVSCQTGQTKCPKQNPTGDISCYTLCQRCDNVIDCPDATDEQNCPCRTRLPSNLICNGQIDCQDLTDELGCSTCSENELSCHESDPKPCIDLSSFCAGHPCLPYSRPLVCTRLAMKQIDSSESIFYKEKGFMHTYSEGKWLPICGIREDLLRTYADDYCSEFSGNSSKKIELQGLRQAYHGLWIILGQDAASGRFLRYISRTCRNNMLAYVECLQPTCQSSPTDGDYSHKKLFERVVGGNDAPLNKWKFMVSIHKDNVHFCGGSIISSRWILSATHCFSKISGEYFEVLTGLWQTSNLAPYVQRSPVAHVIRHPDFDPYTMRYDVVLLRLQKPLRFNRWVQPTCFNGSFEAKVGQLCTLAGWGYLEEIGEVSRKLQEVSVPILSAERCAEEFDFLDQKMAFCAGYEEGGRDSCQGDSGGPMMCQECDLLNDPFDCINKPWSQHGMVSYGRGCARPGMSGVYTNVTYFLKWINETIEQFEENPKDFDGIPVPSTQCDGVVCITQNGTCLPKEHQCNGKIDCFNALDEIGCLGQSQNELLFPALEAETPLSANSEGPLGQSCPDDFFTCEITGECISKSFLCDEVPNCKDGSDELGCTCIDYLYRDHPSRYCDGVHDCFDYSDEPCPICDSNEWFCPNSRKCIPSFQRCNFVSDCFLEDDELNCVALSDSKESILKVDTEGIPFPSSKGHILYNSAEDRKWNPVCNSEVSEKLVTDVCSYLGYGDPIAVSYSPDRSARYTIEYDVPRAKRSYLNSDLQSKRGLNGERTVATRSANHLRAGHGEELPFIASNLWGHEGIRMEQVAAFNISELSVSGGRDKRQTCTQVYIECGERKCGKIPEYYHTNVAPSGKNARLPWSVSIYISGVYKCGGTILEDQWVLTSKKCLGDVSLSRENVWVIGGSNRENVSPRMLGPREVEFRVDAIRPLDGPWDVALLHLSTTIEAFRHLNAICWREEQSDVSNSSFKECVMTGLHGDRLTHPLLLLPDENEEECPSDRICFEEYFLCFNNWSGLIACRTELVQDSTWYAAGLWTYQPEVENCIPSTKSHLRFSGELINMITLTIEKPITETYPELPCAGHKCPMGKCIPYSEVCDATATCPDLSDEASCPPKALPCSSDSAHEICECQEGFSPCSNQFCIESSKFCDGVSDCPFDEDEETCECPMLTRNSDKKISCDGHIDCKDQTDEINCSCSRDQYRCFRNTNDSCLNLSWMCDTIVDCEGGEDEEFCYTISKTLFANEDILRRPIASAMGFLLIRFMAKWYTFYHEDWSSSMSDHVCINLGFHGSLSTSLRKVDVDTMTKDSGPLTVGKMRGEHTNEPLTHVLYIECLK